MDDLFFDGVEESVFGLVAKVFMNEESYSLFLNPLFQFFACRALKTEVFAASTKVKLLPSISWVITTSLFASVSLKTILSLPMVTLSQINPKVTIP